LVAVVLALTALIPRASTARADTTICTLTATGPTCPTFPPPDLLNLQQGGLYAATADQQASLQKLEDQAVSQIIKSHDLADADADAVLSWGRADAEAELYALLLKAIDTSAASRTADQQHAVDWVAAVEQRRAELAALDAGLEYVRWAGLDQGQYQSLVSDSSTTESDLESFLSGTPENYNLLGKNGVPLDPSQFAQSTGGWCVYRSPAPYSTDYTGYNDVTCQDTGFHCNTCTPPTPKYDDLTKWGEADANYALLNSSQFSQSGQVIASALGFGVAAGAGSLALATAPALAVASDGVATAAAAGELSTGALGALLPFSGAIAAASVAAIVLIVIVAFVAAVIDAINVFSAAKLPGQLASLIANAETTPPDPATLEGTTDGATSIFSDFIGATLPLPLNQSCDNSPQMIPAVGGYVIAVPLDQCLNPTPIPPTTGPMFITLGATPPVPFIVPKDPQFLVQARGATTTTSSPTITWKDAAAGTTTTARLSENWFIENESVQTLRITYTDWGGKEQNAWLLGDATDGWAFLNYSPPSDESTTIDPKTCVADGNCSSGTSIQYVGPDGQDYSASVQPYQPPAAAPNQPTTGSPSYSSAVEASPVTFQAKDFAPGGATAPITYTWQFQKAGCGIPCVRSDAGVPAPPSYTDPVSGDTATYTWQTSGTYQVSLTATDAKGLQANDTFTVAVRDVSPRLQVSPTSPETGDVGTLRGLTGTVTPAGSLDNEVVHVNWGDGSAEDLAQGGPNSLPLAGNTLTVTPSSDFTSYTLADTHTYTKPGIYTATVWVYDWGGGSASKTFTETVVGNQSITLPSIATRTYGDAPVGISATGGGSGMPVTFASSDTTVCTVSGATAGVDGSGNGTGNASLTLLKAGTCAITASQAGSAAYHPAQSVTQSFTVKPAPLTVTASSASSTYGGTVPAITPSYSAFAHGDSASALSTQPTCTVAPNSGAAGTYATTCSGAADPRYSFSYVPGALTIHPAPLTVTANNKSMTYGASVPAFDAGYSGLVNGDASGVVSGLTCGAKDGSNTPVSGSTPAGTYSITCSGGTAANYALSYQLGTLTIAKADTSVTLASSLAPAVFGQPVTITATLAAKSPGSGNPGGTVEFKDGGADIGGCSAQPVSTTSETATCTTSSLSVAAHSLTASYSGDSNFNGSGTASALSQGVNKAASSVTLAPVAPVTKGQPATFTAVVAATAPGAGTPGGTVTFKDGSTTLGTGQLGVVGGKAQASFSTSGLGVGAHTITASYGGDGSFTASTSAGVTQYVNTNLSGYPKLPSGAYNLSNANLQGAYFVGVSLVGASLVGSNLTGAAFTNANLQNANLSNSNLKGANFTSANLSGANLSSSNLMGATGLKTATLTGVTWGKTACPDGTLSNNDGGTCVGHL
jgi:hypothetical protein